MKIKIIYQNDGSKQLGCWAATVLPNGKYLSSCADTYEQAKQELLGKIQQKEDNPAPPPEEIELEDSDGPNQ